MAYNENKKAYNRQYTKEHYKRVPLDITTEKYEEIKAAAVSSGNSVNGFIKLAIDEKLARDN